MCSFYQQVGKGGGGGGKGVPFCLFVRPVYLFRLSQGGVSDGFINSFILDSGRIT